MAWSGWSHKDTNMSIGKYRLWYRTDPNYSTDKVGLQYYVEVEDSGTKTERWNCYVRVNVDGKLHSEGWSNYKDKNTTTGAESTVPGHSGYYSGYTCISTKTLSKSVNSSAKASWKLSLAGGFTAVSRRDCTCSVSASDTETTYHYVKGTSPSVSITEVHNDEGVNKVTLSGKLGKSGTNNALNEATLYYTTNGTAPSKKNYTKYLNLGKTSGGSYSKEVTFSSNCTFKAIVYCDFKYNDTNSGTASKAVKYCTAPKVSKAPVLTYTKSRLTVKEPWTFSWTGVNGTNCPIVSYRLRLYKGKTSNKLSQIAIKNSAGTVISDPTHKAYDTGNNKTTFVLDPIANGFEPGDIVRLTIYARGKTANTNNLWWSGSGTTPSSSIEYVVQNAGVMRPLVNGKHVEGVVLVALPNSKDKGYTWTEADVVKVYTPNKTWAEAE